MAEPDGMEDLLSEIKDELTRQSDYKTSLEQRAITVITTSSALATIVFTVVAAVTKIKGAENFVKNEHIWIQIGVGLFLGAAIVALLVNIPLPYRDTDPKSIEKLKTWITNNRASANTHLDVSARLVENGITHVGTLQRRNFLKAILLEFSFFLEVLAVASLLVALVTILANV